MKPTTSNDETVLEHWGKSGRTLNAVRGSLIVSSQQTLREQRLFDGYSELLPSKHREVVLFVSARKWYPVGIAMAHYSACDALELDEEQLRSIGEAVSDRIMGTYLSTILRTGIGLGTSNAGWIALKHYGRLWDRLLDGGGCLVKERGPKDALIESRGVPMFRYRYFREAYVGLVRGAAHLFTKKCYTKETALETPDPDALGVAVSWV